MNGSGGRRSDIYGVQWPGRPPAAIHARGRPPFHSCCCAFVPCHRTTQLRLFPARSPRRASTNPWSPARPPPSAGSPPARPKSTPRRGAPSRTRRPRAPRRAPGAQGVSISTALLPAGRRRRRGGQHVVPSSRRRRPEREPAAEPRADAADAYARPRRARAPRRRAGLRAPVHGEPQGEPAVRADGLRADRLRGRAAGYGGAARLEADGYYGAGSPSPSPPPPSPAPTRRPGVRGPPGPDVQDAPLRLPAGRVPARRSM